MIVEKVFTATLAMLSGVLSSNRMQLPMRSTIELSNSLRELFQSIRSSQLCPNGDFRCWSHKAVEYTNSIRKDRGVSTLVSDGTESQYANARKHAEALAFHGVLYHQDLEITNQDVQCQKWIGGENIARTAYSGDIAKSCVEQWINASGHFEGILAEWYEEAVVGFAYDGRGMVYCVQTFSVQHEAGTTGTPFQNACKKVAESDSDEQVYQQEMHTYAKTNKDKTHADSVSQESSCSCLIEGRHCSRETAQKTEGLCFSHLDSHDQENNCQQACCRHCADGGSLELCENVLIRQICT